MEKIFSYSYNDYKIDSDYYYVLKIICHHSYIDELENNFENIETLIKFLQDKDITVKIVFTDYTREYSKGIKVDREKNTCILISQVKQYLDNNYNNKYSIKKYSYTSHEEGFYEYPDLEINFPIKIKDNILINVIQSITLILGSKILDFFVNYKYYVQYNIIQAIHSGYMFYGGMILSIYAVYIFCKIKCINSKNIFEIIVPNIILLYSICKLGCFFNKCCGGICNFPLPLVESIICFIVFIHHYIEINKGVRKYCKRGLGKIS